MEDIKEFANTGLKSLDRLWVATPECRKHLDDFAKANRGVNDFVLTQMAVNYGYKIAMEDILKLTTKIVDK